MVSITQPSFSPILATLATLVNSLPVRLDASIPQPPSVKVVAVVAPQPGRPPAPGPPDPVLGGPVGRAEPPGMVAKPADRPKRAGGGWSDSEETRNPVQPSTSPAR